MRMNRRGFVKLGAAGLAGGLMGRRALHALAPADAAPRFELVQPELFAVAGGQPNGWADFNNDGSLDLFVGVKEGVAKRLYRSDRGMFVEIAGVLGLGVLTATRATCWG